MGADPIAHAHVALFNIAEICTRFSPEVSYIDIAVCCSVPPAPLIIVIVDAKAFIADTHAVCLLSVAAKACIYLIGSPLLRDDIDDAAHSLTAIEDRAAALDDFNALDAARRNRIEIVLAAPRNRIAIHEDQHTALKAAYVHLIAHRPHRRSVGTECLVDKSIFLLQDISSTCCAALLDLICRDDRRRCRYIHISFLRARRRHDHLAKRITGQILQILRRCHAGSKGAAGACRKRRCNQQRKHLFTSLIFLHFFSLETLLNAHHEIASGRGPPLTGAAPFYIGVLRIELIEKIIDF